MANWSAENAIKAYLSTLKMGNRTKQPDVDIAEFISALAAGNNSQLMVVASAGAADSTTLALVAAAHQTGGRVVCILPSLQELGLSQEALGLPNANHIEFVIGEARNLLLNYYSEADFVVIDCKLKDFGDIFGAMEAGRDSNYNCGVVLGYNVLCNGSVLQQWRGLKGQLLPIGKGLLVARINAANSRKNNGDGCVSAGTSGKRKSHWVVKVDKCTGEEHAFRVRGA